MRFFSVAGRRSGRRHTLVGGLSKFWAVVVVVALVAAALVAAPFAVPAANAANPTPTIGLTRSVASQTLLGNAVAVTLTATNADTSDGFNLSYTDVLPIGVPVADVSPAPTSTFVQTDGSTLLFWSNESDLLHGTTATFAYSFTYPASFDAGKVLAGTAHAYINSDERQIPQFAATTGAVSNSTSSVGPIASSTTLVPFTVTKTDPNAEHELLRGVHDNKSTYTITIRNNGVRETDGYSITDYLPAGLEYLGCVNADNSTAVPAEYTGSGAITNGGFPTGLTNCTDGTSTATTVAVTDASPIILPDASDGTSGKLPNGIYTEVTWSSLGSLAAGASLTLTYAAAVPMRENVMPTATEFNPVANLDNNTGALTTDEQSLTNWVDVSGVYETNTVHVSAYDTVSAEDVAIQKTFGAGQGTVAQQAVTNWTLHVESSEYATQTGAITVTDTIPDGQEYTATQGPAGIPAPSVTTNGDGTQTVVWTLPGFTTIDGDTSILYTTTTLVNYRQKFDQGPVSAGDDLTNTVRADAAGVVLRNNLDDGGASVAAPVHVLDDSQATQTSTTVAITKEVAEPPTAPTSTDCSTDTGLNWTATTTGHYNVGDTVCWRLTVPYLNGLDTLGSTISDLLPAGYTYVSWAETSANTVSFSTTPDTAAPSIKWVISDAVRATPINTFQVILTTVVSDPTAVTSGQLTQNLAKLRWQNSAGAAFQSRDLASTTVDKPVLSIAKSATPTTAVAGSTVNFSVAVTNSGGQDATATAVSDTLPTGWGCAQINTGTITNGGTCASNTITWSGLTVAAGSTLTLTYGGSAPTDVSSGDTFTNSASVTTYSGATNTGGAVVYTPGSNGVPTATATAKVTVPSPTVTKVTDHPTAAIGDTVTWTITSSVLANTTLYNSPTLSDVVPSGYSVSSASLQVNGAAGPATTITGNTVTAPLLPSSTTSISGGSSGIPLSLTIVAVLKNVGANLRTDSLPNVAKLNWTGQYPSAAPHSVSTASIPTVVAEPDLTIAKSDSLNHSQPIVPGGNVTYTIAVTNGKSGDADLSTGHNTVVVDTVPAGILPLNSVDGTPLTADGTVRGTGGTGTWSQSARTITWTIGDVAANAKTTLTYDAQIANPLVANDAADLTNKANVTTTSQTDTTNPNNRSGSPTGTAGYYASTSDTLPNPPISVTKSAPLKATIGDEAPYTVTVTVPKFTVAYDSFAIDTLPADVQFDTAAGITVSCAEGGVAGCADALPATLIPGTTPSSTSFGVWFGNIASASSDRVVTITYSGIVRLPSGVTTYRGNTMTNAIQFFSNTTSQGQASPGNYPSTTGMASSNKATAATTEVEPLLTIAKAVTGTESFTATPPRAKPGSTLDYTVTVGNTGTSTAYDAVVNDLLPKDITCEAITTASTGYSCVDTPSSTTSGATITWTIQSLAVNATVVEAYTVLVPGDVNLTQSLEKNTADIPQYYGENAATRGATSGRYQTYDAATGYDPSANASVTIDRASLSGTFSLDLDANGAFSTGDVDIQGVKVTATLLGAGGVPTGETYQVTTGADGSYLFTDLPPGTWVIAPASDDTTLSGLGVTPSWDADAGTLGTVTSTLSDAQQLTGRDLGYKGTGTIGDTVWFDQNQDGTQNLVAGDTEPGVAGVPVTLQRAASGGLPAITVTTTTSATGTIGRYGFANLPVGNYTVTETTPSGYTVESQPGGGTTGVVSKSLASGEHDTSEDFGLVGSQGFSGTIWLDRDSDAVNDHGEPGLPGVTVTLTTADGASITTTTDADGDYSFAHLPPGSYTVTPSAGLPAGATETYDYDGIASSQPANQAVVQLVASTPDPTDVNFGYNALQTLGGTVFWNYDGADDPSGEPGIPGATVTITYFGGDGVEGGGDDISYTVTTGSDGTWSLPRVSEGNYKVVVSGTPDGFAGNWDTDSPNADGFGTTLVALGATPAPAQDFGYAGTGSIGTTVYLDRDSNGTQATSGEPGLGGVAVTLTYHDPQAGAGNLVLHTTTAADGSYSFPGLPDANSVFTVAITVPTGYTAVSSDGTVGPLTDHKTASVTLTPTASTITDANFGLLGDGELGDTVYLDQNGDGTQQSTEAGIPNVTVTLTWYGPDGLPGTTDDLSYPSITTDSNGKWDESGLPPGTYSVAVTHLPAGVTNTGDPDGGTASQSVVTIGGVLPLTNLAQDFGYQGSVSVGDTIWFDVDGDGTQEAGDPGLSNIPVTVTSAGPDGVLGTSDDFSVTTTTDSSGHYTVSGLPTGPTTVSYPTSSLPAGDVAESDLDGGSAATTTVQLDADRTDVDFVVVGTQQLSGVVFDDKNGNRKQGAGEPGVAGVTINVTWTGPDGPVTLTTVSGPGGAWSLDGMPAGHYTVTADPSTYPPKFHSSIGQNTALTLPAGGTRTVMTGITTMVLGFTGVTTPFAPLVVGSLLALLIGLVLMIVGRVRRRFGRA